MYYFNDQPKESPVLSKVKQWLFEPFVWFKLIPPQKMRRKTDEKVFEKQENR